MNRFSLILIITLASFNASAFTLGPLEITLTSGPNVNVSFTNQFRGLLNNISDVIQNNSVVKFIKYALNYGSNSENIQLTPGKNNVIPPPNGWSDANTPPSTTAQQLLYGQFDGKWFNTLDSLCQAVITKNYPSGVFKYSNGSRCYGITGGQTGPIVDFWYDSGSMVCPSGYTASGSTCKLTNASLAKWPSDGIPTFYQDPTTGQIKLHPRDPDLPTASGAGGTFAGGGASGTWRVPATDQHANPVQVDHTTTSDGGMDVSRKLETVSPETGKSTVYEEITHFNDQGAITQNYTNEYPNTTITNINNNGGTPAAENPTLEFPDITVSGTGGAIPAFNRGNTPTASQSLTDFKNYLNNHPIIKPLRDATFSPSGQACPMQLSVAMAPFGYPMNLSTDIMCQITEIMRPVISTVTTFAWTWLALTVILAA